MLTKSIDSLGGMAKFVEDLAYLTERLLSTSNGPPLRTADIFGEPWSEFKIGFLDPTVWKLPAVLLEPTESYTWQTVRFTLPSVTRSLVLTRNHSSTPIKLQ